jgi:hypothetical protein
MDEFEKELKSFCNQPRGPYLRPFAPNPSWQTASVFIIGTNPATPLRGEFEDFDQYWTGLTQTPAIFWQRYSPEHDGGTSKTTANVKKLQEALPGTNCLITNVSWFPAKRFDPNVRVTDNVTGTPDSEVLCASSRWLKRLIGFCPAKVLFFHGRWGRKFAREAYGVSLDCCQPPREQNRRVDGRLLLAYHHFSGMGLPKGSHFQPDVDIPVFAERIRAFTA